MVGTRTVDQVIDAFFQRYQAAPPRDQVEGLIAQLDAAGLLEGPHVHDPGAQVYPHHFLNDR